MTGRGHSGQVTEYMRLVAPGKVKRCELKGSETGHFCNYDDQDPFIQDKAGCPKKGYYTSKKFIPQQKPDTKNGYSNLGARSSSSRRVRRR